MSTTYAYVGTYYSGEPSRGHVTTDNLPRWITYMTTQGIFPFAHVDTVRCDNPFTCNHGSM